MDEQNTPKKRRWGLWGGLTALAVVGIVSLASASPGTPSTTASTQEAAVPNAVSQPTQQTTAPQTLSNDNYYTNVNGNAVHSPAYTSNGAPPPGATAQCGDGTYSFSQHHSGTCSHHGGVSQWL